MKLISWNVNGIRACAKKGFFEFLEQENPDIICLQETKAKPENLEENILNPSGYHSIWHSAEKKGYSGVAILTKNKPKIVLEGFGFEKYDCEGRVILAEYEHFILLNIYAPNGQKDEERLAYKLDFYRDFFHYCQELTAEQKNLIICGDFNTAHQAIDLANPKANENYSGFLPEERAWLDKFISQGFTDIFRHFHKEPQQYTWWTYRFGARRKNIGWRIDYFFVNDSFITSVKDAFLLPHIQGSDHCPIVLIL
jgi:exodeoxyribonuclease-3